ncbi:MAG: hypothetical protein AAGF12_37605 [Myxococcota bacterium]
MSRATQDSAATTQESAAAAEQLTGQSSELKAMVGRFRLPGVQGRHLSVVPPPMPAAGPRAMPRAAGQDFDDDWGMNMSTDEDEASLIEF